MQKIIVCLKRVVDYNVRIRVKPDGSGVVTEGLKMSINPFDEIALEEALRIREQGKAQEVVLVSIGPDDAQQQLRTGLAMGADRAILVQTTAELEPLAAARVLHQIVAREQPGLVLLGKQAIDDDCNQTGQMLAALWNRPQATFASKLELNGNRGHGNPGGGCRPRSPRGGPAGRRDHRPAPERAPLREAAGHHEGQEEADRDPGDRVPGSGHRPGPAGHPLRVAGEPGHGA